MSICVWSYYRIRHMPRLLPGLLTSCLTRAYTERCFSPTRCFSMSAAISAHSPDFRTNSPLIVAKLTDRVFKWLSLKWYNKFNYFDTFSMFQLNWCAREYIKANDVCRTKKLSIPDNAHFLYLEVRKLKESFVSSVHEEDAAPVYSHKKPAFRQRRPCGRMGEYKWWACTMSNLLGYRRDDFTNQAH